VWKQNGPSAPLPNRSNMKATIIAYYVLMTRVGSVHVAPFKVQTRGGYVNKTDTLSINPLDAIRRINR